MRYSQLFPKTSKQVPTHTESTNHQLLTRAGFIHQEMAGVYTYLPLAWRVLDKISDIVRQEMNAIGAQELLMPGLHPSDPWKQTGRFESFDALFKLKGASDADLVLGPTHEEIIYPLVKEYIKSYRDLPLYLYQIQTKFRNEVRAKAGVLRGREFLMKDLYSFHTSDEERDKYYEEVRKAYIKIYGRIGLPIVETVAGGGTFSTISQEFQAVTPSGEDTIYMCENCHLATNKELTDAQACGQCGQQYLVKKAIEVGNIFPLKDSFAKTFNLTFTDKDGKEKLVSAGCFGLGISRTMGALVEVFHDERGIIWPESVAPYKVHLVGLDLDESSVMDKSEEIYRRLLVEGVEVLYDDRVDASPGEKFADADLIGIPYRIVISKRSGDTLEFKKRSENLTEFVTVNELITRVKISF